MLLVKFRVMSTTKNALCEQLFSSAHQQWPWLSRDRQHFCAHLTSLDRTLLSTSVCQTRAPWQNEMSTPYDRAFFSSFLRPNFVVLVFRSSPRTSVLKTGRNLSTATLPLLRQPACRIWRFVLIRQMAPLNLRTLSVGQTRDPCLYGFILKYHLHRTIYSHVRCALSLRIAELWFLPSPLQLHCKILARPLISLRSHDRSPFDF